MEQPGTPSLYSGGTWGAVVFYIVLYLMNETTQSAREAGWLFPQTATVQWWETWSLFDFSLVEWFVVLEQWMTMSSLAVFTLILVPIRIPSLSIITGDEVNFDEEFKAQGLANILSGLVGAVHNYLSYSNSIFFFYTGTDTKANKLTTYSLTCSLCNNNTPYFPRAFMIVALIPTSLPLNHRCQCRWPWEMVTRSGCSSDTTSLFCWANGD